LTSINDIYILYMYTKYLYNINNIIGHWTNYYHTNNLKRAKNSKKKAFICKQMLQNSSGEISRISFIQIVSKKVLTQN